VRCVVLTILRNIRIRGRSVGRRSVAEDWFWHWYCQRLIVKTMVFVCLFVSPLLGFLSSFKRFKGKKLILFFDHSLVCWRGGGPFRGIEWAGTRIGSNESVLRYHWQPAVYSSKTREHPWRWIDLF
jgi:hypothetical protein